MHRRIAQSAGQIIGQMSGLQVIGLDIAKNVFQLHTVDMSTGEIVNVQLKRAKVLGYFANRVPCLIGIEACGGAHHRIPGESWICGISQSKFYPPPSQLAAAVAPPRAAERRPSSPASAVLLKIVIRG